jgi:hypothetical protein
MGSETFKKVTFFIIFVNKLSFMERPQMPVIMCAFVRVSLIHIPRSILFIYTPDIHPDNSR